MKRFDLYQLQFRTSTAAHHVDSALSRADRCREDEQRQERLSQRLCRRCYYLISKVCGQAFCEWTCVGCGNSYIHHNTCCPQLCYDCATLYSACVDCAADLDLNERRRSLVRKKKLPACNRSNGRRKEKKETP